MKIIFVVMALAGTFNAYAFDLIRVNLHALDNANAQDEKRIYRALELIETVVNSDEFADRVLNMKYKIGGQEYSGFSQNLKTPEEVLLSIREGEENFEDEADQEIDLFLTMYFRRNSTIGYTRASDKYLHMNRYHHQNYTSVQTAGNLFHEWLHKLGYAHSKRNNSYRPHSVPYKLGSLIEEMAARLEPL